MSSIRLALLVLRHDRRSRTSAILTLLGTAVATTLILLLVGVPFATHDRAARTAWQSPPEVSDASQATLAVAASTGHTEGETIARLDVAVLDEDAGSQLPQGVPTIPGPGEVVVSPELAERMAALPQARLADRFPGEIVATLGEAALADPHQLVAVVGHSQAELSPTADPVAGLANDQTRPKSLLRMLAGVGVVVLLIPSLGLVGSASRLTATSRERRLAALRLAGATPKQVSAQVATETAFAAAAGALLALPVMPPVRELAARMSWNGSTWLASDFAVPVWLTVLVVVAIPLFVLFAALLALRRVFTAPLGAEAGHTPKPLHWWRLLTVPAAGGLLYLAINSQGNGMMVFVSLAALLVSASLVGPWLTAAVGAVFVRCWRGPAALLAGRRLTDDPRGAYRASAGVVIAVFTGSLALTVLSSAAAIAGGTGELPQHTVYSYVEKSRADAVVSQTRELLDEYGLDADVSVRSPGPRVRQMIVTVAASEDTRVVARTALVRAVDGARVSSPWVWGAEQRAEMHDLRKVTILGLAAAALLAGCSVAIATAGSIMDRRRTFGALIAAGTPVRVLSRALRVEAAMPALVATIGAGAIGTLVGAALFGMVGGGVTYTAWSATPVVLGVAVAVLAGVACRPVLNRVRAEPLAQD